VTVYLSIVDPSHELELNPQGPPFAYSIKFDQKTGSKIEINGYEGSTVVNVGPAETDLYIYFINCDNVELNVDKPGPNNDEPQVLVAPIR